MSNIAPVLTAEYAKGNYPEHLAASCIRNEILLFLPFAIEGARNIYKQNTRMLYDYFTSNPSFLIFDRKDPRPLKCEIRVVEDLVIRKWPEQPDFRKMLNQGLVDMLFDQRIDRTDAREYHACIEGYALLLEMLGRMEKVLSNPMLHTLRMNDLKVDLLVFEKSVYFGMLLTNIEHRLKKVNDNTTFPEEDESKKVEAKLRSVKADMDAQLDEQLKQLEQVYHNSFIKPQIDALRNLDKRFQANYKGIMERMKDGDIFRVFLRPLFYWDKAENKMILEIRPMMLTLLAKHGGFFGQITADYQELHEWLPDTQLLLRPWLRIVNPRTVTNQEKKCLNDLIVASSSGVV